MNIRRHGTARRGFTFLEIMLVVMIIGLLAAVVGPRIIGQGDKARKRTAAINVKNIEACLKAYELDIGAFPSTAQGLKALVARPSDVDESVWDGPYMDAQEVPKDPWGRDFKYAYPPQKSATFDLYSVGRDGVENTDDDVVNWSTATAP